MTKAHGQSLMAFLRSQYRLRGPFLLDEPESALPPRTQLERWELLARRGQEGSAPFVVATHSPIRITCPGATVYSFDEVPLRAVPCEETGLYGVYADFFEHQERYAGGGSRGGERHGGGEDGFAREAGGRLRTDEEPVR